MPGSYYSERFMGSAQVGPGNNYRGYEDSSLSHNAQHFHNKSLLLLHGTADLNVHYAQTLKFSKRLTEENVVFR